MEHTVLFPYFIMGRSENSRNRVFVEDGLGIKTKAFDESKLTDPSLIIYAPVRVIGNTTIVTNGDQTDTIYDALEQGRTFEDALRTRTFEPDAPNFTPRISGEVVVNNGLQYKLSILKSNNGNPDSALRYFYEYAQPVNGKVILFIRIAVTETQFLLLKENRFVWQLRGDIDSFTNIVWDSLNADNKVSFIYLLYPIGKWFNRNQNHQ